MRRKDPLDYLTRLPQLTQLDITDRGFLNCKISEKMKDIKN